MLGLLALIVVAATMYNWFQLIERVAIPRRRAGWFATFLAGAGIGVIAIAQGGFFSTLFALPAVIAGLAFPALRLQSAQQPNRPAVAVGERMLAITAPDEEGNAFDLASLTGKPYLLKFFRGHW